MNDFVTRWLKLSLVALVGCGFIAMLVYALFMKDEIRSAQVEPPLVGAPEEPAKRRPEEPGGLAIPNQDKMVFDLLEHPSPTDFTSSQPLVSGDEVAVVAASPSAVAASPTVVAESAPVQPAAVPASTASTDKAAVEEVAVAAPSAIKPVVEKPAAKAPAKVAEPKAETAQAAPAAKGDWGVQLAAVGSKADADKAVAKFKAMPALKGMSPHVAQATVNGKGVFRVQFVGVASRPAAASVCAKMAGKQPCLPIEVK